MDGTAIARQNIPFRLSASANRASRPSCVNRVGMPPAIGAAESDFSNCQLLVTASRRSALRCRAISAQTGFACCIPPHLSSNILASGCDPGTLTRMSNRPAISHPRIPPARSAVSPPVTSASLGIEFRRGTTRVLFDITPMSSRNSGWSHAIPWRKAGPSCFARTGKEFDTFE